MMQASVVIPALNEAELLPKLLRDLDAQRGVKFEVIVADAQSTDATRDIARRHGARVVDGGLPAAGRNAGAKVATGRILVFLDADVRVPRTFLRKALAEFNERGLAAGTCAVRPLSRLTTDRIIHNFANLYIRMNQKSDPHAAGYCILIRHDVFDEINGFNESLKVAEDHDLVRRASAHGPFRMLHSTNFRVSVRRFQKEGRIGYALKAIKIGVYRAMVGEITQDSGVVDYEFGDFSEDSARGARRILRKLERGLLELDRQTTDLDDLVVNGTDADPRARERLRQASQPFRDAWSALFGPPDEPGASDA